MSVFRRLNLHNSKKNLPLQIAQQLHFVFLSSQAEAQVQIKKQLLGKAKFRQVKGRETGLL